MQVPEQSPHNETADKLRGHKAGSEDLARTKYGRFRAPIILGVGAIALTIAAFGSWAFTAPIGSAVVAQGTIKPAGNRKKVQHLDGGIIKEIRVRPGATVTAGDVLFVLDGVQARARVSILQGAVDAAMATRARLIAERDGAAKITFPKALAERPSKAVAGILEQETRLFAARMQELTGQLSILKQRVSQLQEQIVGFEAQKRATELQIGIAKRERKIQSGLLKKGLTTQDRVLALMRESARLDGARGKLIADIARARKSIGETRLEILQSRQRLRTEASGRLTETNAKLVDLRERLTAAEDVLNRLIVRAPVSGQVVGLQVHTVGGVVRAGDTLLEIVPKSNELVIEVRIKPTDVDDVEVGQSADVNMIGFQQRTTPILAGKVARVSADALTDQRSGETYFIAEVRIPKGEMAKLPARDLKPGMPTEVMISTGERTAIAYLMQPILDSMNRAWREN